MQKFEKTKVLKLAPFAVDKEVCLEAFFQFGFLFFINIGKGHWAHPPRSQLSKKISIKGNHLSHLQSTS